ETSRVLQGTDHTQRLLPPARPGGHTFASPPKHKKTSPHFTIPPRWGVPPRPPALHKPAGQTRSVGRIIRLPENGRLVLGAHLNRSESTPWPRLFRMQI